MMAGALGEAATASPGRASTASTRTRSAPARCTCGSTAPPAAGPARPAPHTPARRHPQPRRGAPVPEYRRILLDGVRRPGRPRRRRTGRRRRAPGQRRGRPHLPPVEPTKIIAVHLNHAQPRRGVPDRADARPDVLPQADLGAQHPPGRRRAPRGLQVAELRGRGRHRDRPHLPQHLAGRGGRLHRRATRSPTTTACTTSATPTPAPCCG